jgi:UDP-GlcNAc3NAcA epimerase
MCWASGSGRDRGSDEEMKKIVTVLGARPQFIKASVVSHALRASGVFNEVVVHTGQHFDANMSDVFFTELGMAAPAHALGIHGGGHGAMTGQMLAEVERVLLHEKPDVVLVYGDTNSTLAGALAAVKLHIPVAHVEAGLRSFNLAMPEEVNRILTDRIARWLFTPTQAAEQHLRDEGVAAARIVPVGDVMFDVALHHGARVDAGGRLLGTLALEPGSHVLATVHRAENTDVPERLAVIVDALEAIAAQRPVVWPLHPRTRAVLQRAGRIDRLAPNLRLIDPVGYLDMVQLEKFAAVIATDSGGVQKEAFFYRVPCVTLRDETEWVELVDSGWNRLAPPLSKESLVATVLGAVGSRGREVSPYGPGDAARRITQRLAADLAA